MRPGAFKKAFATSPAESADELTALRTQVSELRADLEAIRNVALVAEDAARIRQFIAARENARNA